MPTNGAARMVKARIKRESYAHNDVLRSVDITARELQEEDLLQAKVPRKMLGAVQYFSVIPFNVLVCRERMFYLLFYTLNTRVFYTRFSTH